jgi:hypothetical protein
MSAERRKVEADKVDAALLLALQLAQPPIWKGNEAAKLALAFRDVRGLVSEAMNRLEELR